MAVKTACMPRKKVKPDTEGAETEPQSVGTEMVRINGDLSRKVSQIVAWRKTTTAQLLDPLIRDSIEEEFARVVREMQAITVGKTQSLKTGTQPS